MSSNAPHEDILLRECGCAVRPYVEDASLSLLWHANALREASDEGRAALSAHDQLPFRQAVSWALRKAPEIVDVIERPYFISGDSIWVDAEKNQLFLATGNHGLEVWDMESGSENPSKTVPCAPFYPLFNAESRELVFYPDSNRQQLQMVSLDAPEKVIWNKVMESRRHHYLVEKAFTHDKKYVVVINNFLEVTILDAKTGDIFRKLELGDGSGKDAVAMRLSAHDYKMATFSRSRKSLHEGAHWLTIVDLKTGETLLTEKRGNFAETVAFSPDGKTFAFGENNDALLFYDLQSKHWIPSRLKYPSGNFPTRVRFDSAGKRVFTLNMGMVNAWNWPECDHLFVRRGDFHELLLCPAQKDFLLGAQHNNSVLIDANTGLTQSVLADFMHCDISLTEKWWLQCETSRHKQVKTAVVLRCGPRLIWLFPSLIARSSLRERESCRISSLVRLVNNSPDLSALSKMKEKSVCGMRFPTIFYFVIVIPNLLSQQPASFSRKAAVWQWVTNQDLYAF